MISAAAGSWRAAMAVVVAACLQLACVLPIWAQDAEGLSLSELKAPVCMNSEELVAYQTTLSLATVGAILERCKASFSDRLDPKQIKAVEDANSEVLQQPGSVMRGINARAREPFKRAYPGREASKFADVLQADLQRIMGGARPETLESCQQVIGLWRPKIAENIWEETLVSFGNTTFRRNVIRHRPAFPGCG
jgi:hypothetical protein